MTLPITTSRATSHSPPPSHATRAAPAGTSPASASTASAQSRRAAGSSPAERPSSPASTRVNRSITPPPPPPCAWPARPAAAARRCLQRCLFGQRRPGRGQAVGAEPVQVPPRAPGWLPVLPARLDQATLSQPDQDRIQRARPQPGLPGEQIAMPPGGGVRLQRSQYRQCLGGEPGTTSHGVELYLDRP